ncbi:MAG: hypothetical protein Q8M00_00590, partial [bacterium]|nr:hypothetical protein [bacterium]
MKTLKLPIILIVILVVFAFLFVGEIKAGTGDNVSGWAWIGTDCTDPTETTCETKTNPVSWISFNDTNSEITCSGIFYGVNVDYSTGEISGAAWIGVGENNVYTDCNTSENTVGWLYFDSVSTPSCGTGGYPSDYCFPVKIVGNEIHGWAPIISKDSYGAQTTVTWVRFKGGNYSVKINSDGTVGSGSGATDHYAWSNFGREGGLGWIDLARVRFPALNQPPSATNLSVDPPNSTDYCGITGYPPVRLRWQFSDPGDSQSVYQIQIDTDLNFSNPRGCPL